VNGGGNAAPGLPKLIAVVGTNASGKSGLGVELALRYGGEIVSADSRQVYRGLNLGSGKITPEETRGVPHHLLDVCGPGDFFSMADFQRLAYEAVSGILSRGKIPFLVGGTGLYVDAVTKGYALSDVKPDLAYRGALEAFSTSELYQMLLEKAPGTAADPKNRNRVMRMLEKLHDGDAGHGEPKPRYRVLTLGVTWPRAELCRRIDERLARRMEDGLEREVRGLLASGATPEFLRGLGLEYRYVSAWILGEIPTKEDMLAVLAQEIKRFAKRQMTWFKRNGETVWLDMAGDPAGQACAAINEFLAEP
jgi:tRNA dimethylallyltransferase